MDKCSIVVSLMGIVSEPTSMGLLGILGKPGRGSDLSKMYPPLFVCPYISISYLSQQARVGWSTPIDLFSQLAPPGAGIDWSFISRGVLLTTFSPIVIDSSDPAPRENAVSNWDYVPLYDKRIGRSSNNRIGVRRSPLKIDRRLGPM